MIVHDVPLGLLFEEIDWLYDRYMRTYLNTIDYQSIGSFGKLRILRGLHCSDHWDALVEDTYTRYQLPSLEHTQQFLTELYQILSIILLPLFQGQVNSLYELRFCKGVEGSVEYLMYMTEDEWDEPYQGYFLEGALHNPPAIFSRGEDNQDDAI